VGGEEAWDASARKNGKEIFGFASPLLNTSYNNLEYNTTEYYNANT